MGVDAGEGGSDRDCAPMAAAAVVVVGVAAEVMVGEPVKDVVMPAVVRADEAEALGGRNEAGVSSAATMGIGFDGAVDGARGASRGRLLRAVSGDVGPLRAGLWPGLAEGGEEEDCAGSEGDDADGADDGAEGAEIADDSVAATVAAAAAAGDVAGTAVVVAVSSLLAKMLPPLAAPAAALVGAGEAGDAGDCGERARVDSMLATVPPLLLPFTLSATAAVSADTDDDDDADVDAVTEAALASLLFSLRNLLNFSSSESDMSLKLSCRTR